ncbi:MAG TPA: hypothetical protein GXZ45_12850 [Propionibacterium sp.]|nr:hypothetical protein [Propionibacterium sp.]
MTAAFAPGFYTTKAESASVAGDWRLAGWTPKVLQLPEDLGNDPRRTVLAELGRALGVGEVTAPAALGEALRKVGASTVLVWARGQAFADAEPGTWKAIGDALEKRAKTGPDFAVVLAGADKKSKERDR